MTRRSTIISGIVAFAAIALAVPAAFSRGPDGPGGGFGKTKGERGARFMRALDLSEDQATALKALREERREDAKATRQELRTKRQAIRAQWASGAPDRAAILALTSEISAIQAQLAVDRVDFLFAAKEILTPEQLAKLAKRAGKGGPGMRGGKRGFGKRGGFHERGGKRGFGKRGAFTGPPAPETSEE